MLGMKRRNLSMMQSSHIFLHAAGVKSRSSQLAASRSELDSTPVLPEVQIQIQKHQSAEILSGMLSAA